MLALVKAGVLYMSLELKERPQLSALRYRVPHLASSASARDPPQPTDAAAWVVS